MVAYYISFTGFHEVQWSMSIFAYSFMFLIWLFHRKHIEFDKHNYVNYYEANNTNT